MINSEIDYWINERTGERVPARQKLVKVARNDFEIVYLATLFNVLEKLGGKKYQVFKYIIQNKSIDNTLIITNRELAKKAGVSYGCVAETLKLLKELGIIKNPVGAIFLNPRLMNRGTLAREAYIMQKFEMIGGEESCFQNSTYKSDGIEIEQNNFFDAI